MGSYMNDKQEHVRCSAKKKKIIILNNKKEAG